MKNSLEDHFTEIVGNFWTIISSILGFIAGGGTFILLWMHIYDTHPSGTSLIFGWVMALPAGIIVGYLTAFLWPLAALAILYLVVYG